MKINCYNKKVKQEKMHCKDNNSTKNIISDNNVIVIYIIKHYFRQKINTMRQGGK